MVAATLQAAGRLISASVTVKVIVPSSPAAAVKETPVPVSASVKPPATSVVKATL